MIAMSFCSSLKTLLHSEVFSQSLKPFKPRQKIIRNCTILNNFATNKGFPNDNEEEVKNKKLFVKGGGVVEKKKIPNSPKISVIQTDGTKSIMYLEQAQKLAKRNNLNLEKVGDYHEKAIYQLVKAGKFQNEEPIKKNKKVKKIALGSEILENDLLVKINQMKKILNKEYSVIVMIEGNSNPSKIENIYTIIENKLGSDFQIKGKNKMKAGIQFTILPQAKKKEIRNDESTMKES